MIRQIWYNACMKTAKRVRLCKPVKGGMTEQEKAEAGYLYNPNRTNEMAK